ncbi:MAG: hypothetical protein AAF989_06970 [Planctomycetota bacterium]
MAKCDEGYPCEVCGNDVESIVESDLYLRFVIGELDPEVLHTSPERHLRCNTVLSQFIVDDRFAPVTVDGLMDRRTLDPDFVRERTDLVTRGYRRLLEINQWDGDRDVTAYPLKEVIAKYSSPDS